MRRLENAGEMAERLIAPVLKTGATSIANASGAQHLQHTAESALALYLPLLRAERPDLARVVAAWDSLPDAIRRAVLALIGTTETQ